MATTLQEQVLALASERRLIRASDVREHGWSPQVLMRLHASGELRRVARGVYSLPDAAITEFQTFAEACRRVPKGVVCLVSALRLHDIGTQAPHEVWIALPEASRTPAVDNPPLCVVRMRGPAYSEGIQTLMDEGAPIRVYSPAKTIVDCFKFRNRIGMEPVLEALKDAWRRRLVTMEDLGRFARVARMERVMQPYLETLGA